MTGAEPHTKWLEGCVALDEKGFVKTGSDLRAEDLSRAAWPLPRAPYLFETNRAPGLRRWRRSVGEREAGRVGGRGGVESAFSWSIRSLAE